MDESSIDNSQVRLTLWLARVTETLLYFIYKESCCVMLVYIYTSFSAHSGGFGNLSPISFIKRPSDS